MKTNLKTPKIYSSSPKNYVLRQWSAKRIGGGPISPESEGDTYADRKHVDGHDQDQEHGNPDSIVDALASCPIQHGCAVVVTELDSIRDGNQFSGRLDSVGKPLA